jgi:hypothetical protein
MSVEKSSDLRRLVRVAKIIAGLAEEYEDKDIAEALLKHCTQRERDAVALAGSFLSGLWELYHKAEEEAEPRCCECGGNVYDAKDSARAERGDTSSDFVVRTDVRYCSAKCRQRAYRRRRVTRAGSGSRRKRHAAKVRDISVAAHDGQA